MNWSERSQIDSIRVLIIDDHALFRQALTRLLDSEPGFCVVGQHGTADEALEAVGAAQPDIVLLDIDLPGRTAADFLRMLPAGLACPTLLITGISDEKEIARLIGLGARGVFFKGTDSSRLLAAIRQTLAGEVWVDQVYLKGMIAAAANAPEEVDGPATSSREQEVLALVARGLSNKQIAHESDHSEAAVKAALQRLFRKFGVSNRAQLLAVTAGLIPRVAKLDGGAALPVAGRFTKALAARV